LRNDYSAAELRALAGRSKDVNQSQRLLSLAAVRDGMDRGEAAKIGGKDRQTLRDSVHRFNVKGPDGLIGQLDERSDAASFCRSIGRADRDRPEVRTAHVRKAELLESLPDIGLVVVEAGPLGDDPL
jgi:hypothetical protein